MWKVISFGSNSQSTLTSNWKLRENRRLTYIAKFIKQGTKWNSFLEKQYRSRPLVEIFYPYDDSLQVAKFHMIPSLAPMILTSYVISKLLLFDFWVNCKLYHKVQRWLDFTPWNFKIWILPLMLGVFGLYILTF